MAHAEQKISDYVGSYASLSVSQSDTAVVFVHGFWGDSVSTWRNFQTLIDSSPPYAKIADRTDFYFYDFKTRKDTVNGHSSEFQKFMHKVFPLAERKLFGEVHSSARLLNRMLRSVLSKLPPSEITFPRNYTNLVLVGHSLGGVIVRRALLNDLDANGSSSCCINAKLRLFAPAQAGFRQKDALSSAMNTNPVTGLFLAFTLVENRAFNDLMPGSPPLEQLKTDNIALAKYASCRAKIAWAKGDFVVFDTKFSGDNELRITGKDHRSVCKPRNDYLDPLEMVLK